MKELSHERGAFQIHRWFWRVQTTALAQQLLAPPDESTLQWAWVSGGRLCGWSCQVCEQHSVCAAGTVILCNRLYAACSRAKQSAAQRSRAVPADRVLRVSSCDQVQQKGLVWVHPGCCCEVQNTKLALLYHINCIPEISGTLWLTSNPQKYAQMADWHKVPMSSAQTYTLLQGQIQ